MKLCVPDTDPDPDSTLLGAHVDGNIFTLLWRQYGCGGTSDSCLQVPHTHRNPTLTADVIERMGMPMMGLPNFPEVEWADVNSTEASSDMFLFSVGNGIFRENIIRELDHPAHGVVNSIECPLYHRVGRRQASTSSGIVADDGRDPVPTVTPPSPGCYDDKQTHQEEFVGKFDYSLPFQILFVDKPIR